MNLQGASPPSEFFYKNFFKTILIVLLVAAKMNITKNSLLQILQNLWNTNFSKLENEKY